MAASESIGQAASREARLQAGPAHDGITVASEDVRLCGVINCSERAVTSESGEVGRWIVVIPYCQEHARELAKGTPLGAVGLDSSRVLIAPVEAATPKPGSRLPGMD
jgi:hypothetical protein